MSKCTGGHVMVVVSVAVVIRNIGHDSRTATGSILEETPKTHQRKSLFFLLSAVIASLSPSFLFVDLLSIPSLQNLEGSATIL